MNKDLDEIKSPKMEEQQQQLTGDPIKDFLVIYQNDLKILNPTKQEEMPNNKDALLE